VTVGSDLDVHLFVFCRVTLWSFWQIGGLLRGEYPSIVFVIVCRLNPGPAAYNFSPLSWPSPFLKAVRKTYEPGSSRAWFFFFLFSLARGRCVLRTLFPFFPSLWMLDRPPVCVCDVEEDESPSPPGHETLCVLVFGPPSLGDCFV